MVFLKGVGRNASENSFKLFMNQDNRNESPSALSLTLVGIQFVLIGMIAFTGPLWPPGWSLRVILAVGGVVGLWALQVMGLRQVKVFPEVPQPGETHCPRSLPLGQASHVYQRLVGDPGLDSGKSASLPYSVMGGISDDLIGQTPATKSAS